MRSISSCLCYLLMGASLTVGQEPRPERYFPLNTPFPPPGRAGEWAGQMGQASPVRFQPVEIQLPGEGQVTWFGNKGHDSAVAGPAPSMAGLLVGPVYRLKLADMPDYPGVELYPSIEMVDRLHPPMGREAEFPVIVPFTAYEIESATQGRLVTKVIYLEQPNRASLQAPGRGKAVAAIRVNPRTNPLEVADIQGRPLAIVRLGGRVPDANRPEPEFFGSGGPVQTVLLPTTAAEVKGDDVELPAEPAEAKAAEPEKTVEVTEPETTETAEPMERPAAEEPEDIGKLFE